MLQNGQLGCRRRPYERDPLIDHCGPGDSQCTQGEHTVQQSKPFGVHLNRGAVEQRALVEHTRWFDRLSAASLVRTHSNYTNILSFFNV